MKLTIKLATATAFVTLAACGGSNNANNTADVNAATDLNAGTTDMNATDMNSGGMNDMNATGKASLNTTATSNTAGRATTNNSM